MASLLITFIWTFSFLCLVSEWVDHLDTRRHTKGQPTLLTVMTACALFGGPALNYRVFKQSAPRNIRGLAYSEITAAIRGLEEAGLGKVCSVTIPRLTYRVIVFVKEDPDKVQWPKDICCQTDYCARFHQAVNKSITTEIKRTLIASNCIPNGMFADIEWHKHWTLKIETLLPFLY